MRKCIHCGCPIRGQSWRCDHCGFEPEVHNGHLSFAPQLGNRNNSYETEFFAVLSALEPGHFWFEARNQIFKWCLGKFFSDAASFMEIGCGTGFALAGIRENFPALSLTAAELLFSGISFAQQRVPDATIYQMDGSSLPFENEFDVIGAFDVLEHIEDDERVIQEMFRSVKHGGGIILTVPQHRFLWSSIDEHSHHYRRYSRQELTEKVEQAGFRTVYTTSFVSLLLPLMLLSRRELDLLQRKPPSKDFSLLDTIKMGKVSNTFMSLVMGLEIQFIRRGVSFPMGGSLLLIGQRP